jgi:integrase
LRAHDLNLEKSAVTVHQAVWNRQVQTPKTDNANREFALSPDLAKHLRDFLATWRPNSLGLLFTSRSGLPLDRSNFAVQRLWPLLDSLGISRCGLHAFRHTNGSLMERIGAPMKLRQQRLGHAPGSDITVTVYTHLIGDDDQKVAAQLGEILRPDVPKFDLVRMQTHGTQ